MNIEQAKGTAVDYARRDQERWYVFQTGEGQYAIASQLDQEAFWGKEAPVFTADPVWLQPARAEKRPPRLPPAARLHHLRRFYGGSRS